MVMKKVAVFCGSAAGNKDIYRNAAESMATYFVDKGITMVNGGGSIGIMGIMADKMLELGGKCIGVIALDLKERELAHYGMTELITTPCMHSRKKIIYEISDGFIALPGGYGTLDELFESITWRQLHLINKPVGILNVDGYFDPLIDMVDKMHEAGFMNLTSKELFIQDDKIEILIDKLNQAVPVLNEKWESH